MKKVIVIVGPTGSGKSKLSIQLAKHFDKEIINGDSVQVYKGLDIGSAKISLTEMKGIKHHLLSIVEPNSSYSVFHFQKDVRKLLDELNCPIIVGGTGLYIKASLSKYDFVEKQRNEDFEFKYQEYSNEQLYDLLVSLDPKVIVEKNNRRRVLRALEQTLLGEPRSKKTDKDLLLYNPLVLYLDLNKEELNQRLILRLDQQIKDGFIDEVKSLNEKNIFVNAIGYRELSEYLKDLISLDQAKEEIIKASKRLAKKQKTYFKNQMNPIFLDALSSTLFEDAKKLIIDYLERN